MIRRNPVAEESEPGEGDQAALPTIQTVQRAALILDSFTVSKPRLSLNEITTRLGASKATAHRYTKALRAAKLLRYDERTALYSLGPQVLTLAASARAGMPIVTIAEPFMDELLKTVNETVVLSVWDGETATVVRTADNTDHIIRIGVRTGARLDLTSSAQGRVFCAYLPPDEVPGLAKHLRRIPDLQHELESIRKHRLSVNSPTVNGVHTIAAPIFEGEGIIAAMAIIGTTVSVSGDVNSPMARALLDVAQALSQRLGNST
jgi:DNA-binding IclR family transcriptional regulator